ncbi:MAG: energy transducer TonB [Magnetococcales bacterium]|nr:energy transducer TonB [Magnetococcales bacterium]
MAQQVKPRAERPEPSGDPASPPAPSNAPGNNTTHATQAAHGTGEVASNEPLGQASTTVATPAAGNAAPVYPIAARRAGREGRTVLRVRVATTGECDAVQIVASSGTPSLDEAAMAAVRQWRFNPARLADRAIEATIQVPIVFKLTDAF